MAFVWNGTTEMRLITYFPYFQCFKQEVGVKEGFELYVLKVLSFTDIFVTNYSGGLSHGGEVMSLCECMQQKSRLWRFSITMEGLIFNFEDFANKNLYLKFKQS